MEEEVVNMCPGEEKEDVCVNCGLSCIDVIEDHGDDKDETADVQDTESVDFGFFKIDFNGGVELVVSLNLLVQNECKEAVSC